MNTSSESRSKMERDQLVSARQEAEPVADATLLELGNVSDTRGGWLGVKLDVGAGFIPY